MKEKRKMKTRWKVFIGFLALVLIATSAFFIYVSDYYHADQSALNVAISKSEVEISNRNGALEFDPGNADTAIIFYPGGKVEYTAYEPLMIKIAQKGILCILPKMPFNLAVFDIDAADQYLSDYPDIQHWYVGGHSLGGSMAARYASTNSETMEGFILLASYSTSDVSASNMKVLSIYGTNDGVLNKKSYEKNKRNLPSNMTELVLEGGNHAGFGCYGPQHGDGKADITSEQQQTDTAQAIEDYIFTKKR